MRWVRSDTALPPFARARERALEALEAFRGAGHKKGQVRSLVAASAMADPRSRQEMLSEAETLAAELGEEDNFAMVLARRAWAMPDRVRADELHRRALAIYQKTGNEPGQARCLFSLAIGEGPPEERRDFAIEAARIYRAIGDPAEAARSMTLAILAAESIQPITDLEDLAQQGLRNAQDAGNRAQELHFAEKLELIALVKGEHKDIEKYRRWAIEVQDADGLTPRERWERNCDTIKVMIAMAKTQGQIDAAKMFQDELTRLKASKPS